MNTKGLSTSAFFAWHAGIQRGHREHWMDMARRAKEGGDTAHLANVYVSFARNANTVAIRNMKEARA